MIPFVVLLDAIFRSADLLFVSPDMLINRPENANDDDGGESLLDRCEIENSEQSNILQDIITERSSYNVNLPGHTEEASTGNVEGQITENPSEIKLGNLEADEAENPPAVEQAGADSVRENGFFAYFRVRIHRPILRIINYHIIEVLFLFSLTLTLVDPLDEDRKIQKNREKQCHFYDYITMVFTASYCLESALDLVRRKWGSLSSFWTIYNMINSTILSVGGLVSLIAWKPLEDDNRAKLSGNHPVNVGSTLFALGASLSLLKPLRWFLLDRSLGPVVVCIIKVLKDAFQIFKIFLIVFFAFSVTSYFMFKPFSLHDDKYKLHQDDLVTPFGLFSAMFWRVFDPGQPHYAAVLVLNLTICKNISEETNNNDEYDINCISDEFSHLMGMAIWAAYQGITVILLINILIAMMNTTYHRIWDSSDTQWKYSKSFYQIQFIFPRASLPSPFRILYYIVKIIYDFKKRSGGSLGNSRYEKLENYKNKLMEIVMLKVHSDYENSLQEDFSDLRQDLQNHITEKQRQGLVTLQEGIKDLKSTLGEPRDQLEDLKREVRSLMKDRRGMEDEMKDLKTLIQTLIDQRTG